MTSETGAAPSGTSPEGQDLASLSGRFVALVVDWVSCLVVTWILGWIGIMTPDPFGINLFIYVLFIFYYTYCMTAGTQSLGMRLMRVACVSAATGGRLGVLRALVRVLLLTLVIPALTSYTDEYRRGLHDKAAGSVMLKV
ncbi:RDD family protein [Glycomyces buryatensis]|uniref:RDD family protein n=1 Tax=Glycomyces buryatensis TaxID=2570927 RepID=A0A4S8Q7Z2_9ACTN|nr:RDD family protein [Glycomyces buryatensis]THV39481.1 RDD family protein [Glycomyces buryatensis]